MSDSSSQEGTGRVSEDTLASEEVIRPLVASARVFRGGWVFAGFALLAAVGLFEGLESRRAIHEASDLEKSQEANASPIAAPPELVVPPEPVFLVGREDGQGDLINRSPPGFIGVPQTYPRVVTRQTMNRAERASPGVPLPAFASPYPPPQRIDNGFDQVRNSPPALPAAISDQEQGKPGERVRATRFANPGNTIPKGTVMQAVLESALDSTRAGMARAIISRDVFSFDGTQVLVPRGSRLIGEYKADLAVGQKRALIQWQRLMRPDGIMINLDSPSADPLGRAGVKGKVTSHFFDRFGGAILQSALDIGVQAAANKIAGGSTIYALPGLYALSGAAQGTRIEAEKVQPTLTVAAGSSVSVFVARDLDFSAAQP